MCVPCSNHHYRKADIWSVGITALQIGHGRAPYEGEELIQVAKRIVHDPPPTAAYYRAISKTHSRLKFCKPYHQFVAMALTKNANERPSANALLESRFIKKYARGMRYLQQHLCNEEMLKHVRRSAA
mmetsp:Transcript_1925/g.2774  ORF Transcript_1925/g.2774 Transcript_1925/m.2774 type:complete len:127 (-) Transcript_1925:60-440(-)